MDCHDCNKKFTTSGERIVHFLDNHQPLLSTSPIANGLSMCCVCHKAIVKEGIGVVEPCKHSDFHYNCLKKELKEVADKCPICGSNITSIRKILV